MQKVSQVEVSHPCDECQVETYFTLGACDNTIVHEDMSIEYWKDARCADCDTVSTHIGVYEADWLDEEVEYDLA